MPKPNIPIGERVTRLLARHGVSSEVAKTPGVQAAVMELLTDNLRYRDRARAAGADPAYKPDATGELERENERLELEVNRLSALVPAAGAVVLVGEDVTAYAEYKKLGTPADLKKSLDELPTLRTTVSTTQRATTAGEAATLLGWNREATIAAIGDKSLVVSLVDGKDKDGKAIKVPHVRPASDEKATTVPLADWIDSNAKYLLPSLSAAASSNGNGPAAHSTAPSFPPQSGGGTPPSSGDAVTDFIKRTSDARAAGPNPLVPPRKAAATT